MTPQEKSQLDFLIGELKAHMIPLQESYIHLMTISQEIIRVWESQGDIHEDQN